VGMPLRRCFLPAFLILTAGMALVPCMQVFAQTGLYDPWQPPSGFTATSAVVGGSFSSHVEDRTSRTGECFDVNDFPLVLVIDMPPNAVSGWLWVREYYPPSYVLSGDLFPPPRFLSGSGRQTVSGITYNSGSPEGNYAWRIGLLWVDVSSVVWWTVQIQFWKLGCSHPLSKLATQLSLTASPSSAHPGDSVSATASISPQVTGGVISILYTPPKGQQVPVCSQQAAGGSVTCPFTVGDPGSGSLLATYSGYVDSAANLQYLQSQSSPIAVQVSKYSSKVTVSIEPTGSEIDAVTGAAESVTIVVLLTRSDGRPISGASVQIEIQGPQETSKSARTNPSGEYGFTFTPKSSGSYTVRAVFAGDDQNEPAEDETTVAVNVRWTTGIAMLLIAAIVIASVFVLWRSRRRRHARTEQTWGPSQVSGPRLVAGPPTVYGSVPAAAEQTVCFGCGKQFSHTLRACPNCGKPT